MGLVLNLILQTIVWFGFMGAIIFGAAGTTDYAGGCTKARAFTVRHMRTNSL